MRYAAASASNGSAKRANNSVAGLKTVEELSSKDVLTVPDLVAVLLFVLYVSLGLVYYVIGAPYTSPKQAAHCAKLICRLLPFLPPASPRF